MVALGSNDLFLALVVVLVMFACFGAKFGAGGGFAGPCFGAGDSGGCIGGGCIGGGVTNGRTPTGHHGATGWCHQEKATPLVPPDSESGARSGSRCAIIGKPLLPIAQSLQQTKHIRRSIIGLRNKQTR